MMLLFYVLQLSGLCIGIKVGQNVLKYKKLYYTVLKLKIVLYCIKNCIEIELYTEFKFKLKFNCTEFKFKLKLNCTELKLNCTELN